MPAHPIGALLPSVATFHISGIPGMILLLALIIDRLFGDPQDRFHTTAYMGKMIDFLKNLAPRHGDGIRTFYGAFLFFAVTFTFSVAAYLLVDIIPYPISLIIGAVILKLQLSWKGLSDFTTPIENRLENGDLAGARTRLSSVVGRDVTTLDEEHVASATIETIGENSVDGIISPLFYFAVFGIMIDWRLGVTAAVFYRAANTLDSMVGYKNREYRALGTFSARADDLLNLIPARLASILIIISSLILKKDSKNAIKVLIKDRSRTPSPNSGHPISAVAGALGIRLEKIGFYKIGDGKAPDPTHIDASLGIVDCAVVLFIVSVIVAAGMMEVVEMMGW
jgi:adenosylcobinamide-phosphate synthase